MFTYKVVFLQDPEQARVLNLEEFSVPVNKPKHPEVQAISLLPSGSCRGITLSSFEPSAEECSSITCKSYYIILEINHIFI